MILELVSGLQLATINGGMLTFSIVSGATGRPAQAEIRAKGKHHRRTVKIRLNAHALFGGGQGEIQGLSEDDRIRLAHVGVDGRTKDLGLEKKGGCIRPIQGGGGDYPTTLAVAARIDPRERAGPGNARSSNVPILVVRTCVHGHGSGGGFPQSKGGEGILAVEGYVS